MNTPPGANEYFVYCMLNAQRINTLLVVNMYCMNALLVDCANDADTWVLCATYDRHILVIHSETYKGITLWPRFPSHDWLRHHYDAIIRQCMTPSSNLSVIPCLWINWWLIPIHDVLPDSIYFHLTTLPSKSPQQASKVWQASIYIKLILFLNCLKINTAQTNPSFCAV